MPGLRRDDVVVEEAQAAGGRVAVVAPEAGLVDHEMTPTERAATPSNVMTNGDKALLPLVVVASVAGAVVGSAVRASGVGVADGVCVGVEATAVAEADSNSGRVTGMVTEALEAAQAPSPSNSR